MYKRSDMLRRALERSIVVIGTAGALALLLASISAVAGEIDAERQRDARAVKKTPPVLLLRCWQDGQLLFEEPIAALPVAARKSARLSVLDRNGRALQVLDMTSATCLVRSMPAGPYRDNEGDARR